MTDQAAPSIPSCGPAGLPTDQGAAALRSRASGVDQRASGARLSDRDGIPIMLVDEARPLDEDQAIPEAVRATEDGAARAMSADNYPWPTELRVDRAAKTLGVSFDDGVSFTLPAEFLRVESPSAEVQGHGPGQKTNHRGAPPRRDHGPRAGRQLRRAHHVR